MNIIQPFVRLAESGALETSRKQNREYGVKQKIDAESPDLPAVKLPMFIIIHSSERGR